jgi:predicted CxxxxCH...CXXCH cytochrome family protein
MIASARRVVLEVTLALAAAWAASGCLDRQSAAGADSNPCTECHGSDKRPGDALTQAAPPRDLEGRTATSAPGVGAHLIHLQASATHAEVACDECHLVPESTYSEGHIDTRLPAEVHFGTLARQGDRVPEYQGATHSCVGTYCHAAAQPNWIEPRDSTTTCGTCHGLPPPDPHPQVRDCSACHTNVTPTHEIVDPARHVDGTVDF